VPLFTWRTRRQDELVQQLTDMRESIDALSRTVADLAAQVPREPPVPGWRVARLWSYVILLFAAAVAVALVGTKAFTDVNLSDAGSHTGSVAFYLTTGPDGPTTTPAYIMVRYSAADDRTSYAIAVPTEYVGRGFALYLSGTAVMPASRTADALPITVSSEPCVVVDGADYFCQTISGKIPPPSTAGPRYGGTWGCENPPPSRDYTYITVEGHSNARTKVDMFHEAITMPRPAVEAGLTTEGLPAPGISPLMRRVSFESCRMLEAGQESELTAYSENPTTSVGNTHYWSTPADRRVDVLLKRRDADRWANVSLATAGALAGLAVGLLPMATESGSVYRRQRRRPH
jgi:hypothetical protein